MAELAERSDRGMTLVAIIAIALTSMLILLGLSLMIVSSPNDLFPVVILVMIGTLGVLIKSSYPKYSHDEVLTYLEVDPETRGDPSEAAGADWNDELRQYQAYLELKHLLIDRMRTRRSIKGDEWDALTKDVRALYQLLGDEELMRLLSLDDRLTRIPRSHRIRGMVLGPDFREHFEQILGKVEKWQ